MPSFCTHTQFTQHLHAQHLLNKGYLHIPLASSSLLRKTPVHKLYSSGLSSLFQSDDPTKAPPVQSQLPEGFHHLYSLIEYECVSAFYHHSGSSRRTCLKTGKWSGRHVSCSPGEGSRGLLVVGPPPSHRTNSLTHILNNDNCIENDDVVTRGDIELVKKYY